MWRIRSKLVDLLLEPRLEFVCRHRHTRMAADRKLKHASIIELSRVASHGYQPPSRVAQIGHSGARWCLGRMAASPSQREHGRRPSKDPFLDFDRTAEASGYPATLIVSVFALAARSGCSSLQC